MLLKKKKRSLQNEIKVNVITPVHQFIYLFRFSVFIFGELKLFSHFPSF